MTEGNWKLGLLIDERAPKSGFSWAASRALERHCGRTPSSYVRLEIQQSFASSPPR